MTMMIMMTTTTKMQCIARYQQEAYNAITNCNYYCYYYYYYYFFLPSVVKIPRVKNKKN
jgi:hypothetical protein